MSLRCPDVWCKRCFGEVVNGRCRECGGQNPPMPQTPAERQEARRKRLLIGEGRTEVRGIFLPPALHAALKAEARKLLEKHKPKEKK